MGERDPYSRHYWKLIDDSKFAEVYGDDHHYATWSRLLMLADQAWPATAHIPMSARRSSITKLAEVRLIEVLPGGRFRMVGTDNERRRRSEHAQVASNARWNAPSIAPRNAPEKEAGSARISAPMPSNTEQSRASQSRAQNPAPEDDRQNGEAPEDDAPEGELITWLARHKVYVKEGSGWHRFLIGLVERRGAGECLRGLVAIERANPGERFSDKQWLTALADLVEVKPSVAAVRAEVAGEQAAEDFRRRVDKTRRYIESLRGEHDEPKAGLTKLPPWTPPRTAA